MSTAETGPYELRLNVIDRESDNVEAVLDFWPSEVAMPNYVEHASRRREAREDAARFLNAAQAAGWRVLPPGSGQA